MHKLSVTHESILDKERMCIRFASRITLGKYRDNSLLSDLRTSLFSPFKGAGILAIPLVLLFAPFGIYDAVCSYRERERERNEINARDIGHTVPLQNLADLWEKYGLSVDQFVSEEHLIADCLSQWLEILFEKKYYYSPSEIIEQFHDASIIQGRIMSGMYSAGMYVNMEDWRSVVVCNITQKAPIY